jgi:RNA polymerase sigma factor for flagellar operon FliA
MIGEGIFGLIDAIDKYDVRKNVKFETYASLRIRGAILDKLRKMDLLSRNTRDRVRLIEDVSDELEKRLGRTPSEAEIAAPPE